MHFNKTGRKRRALLFFLIKGLSLSFLHSLFFLFCFPVWMLEKGLELFKLLACMGRCWAPEPGLAHGLPWEVPPLSLSSWCIQPLLVRTRSRSHCCLSGCGLNPDLGAPMGHLPESARSCLPQGDCWYPSLPRVIWRWSWGGWA